MIVVVGGRLTLAVITRVALGHTGRELVVARPIVAAYVLAIAGAALRVAGPALSGYYLHAVATAGVLWAASFVVFLVVYGPILVARRPDEKAPGGA